MLLRLLLAAALLAMEVAPAPEKEGAGLFLCSGGEALLLLRVGKHNAGKWGLPGGNVEAGDGDLLATATREGREELGTLPPFTVQQQLLTRRGQRLQKHFTVFMAAVGTPQRALYRPVVNQLEHSQARWFDWDQLQAAAAQGLLHPVVKVLLQEQGPAVKAALGVS